MASNSNNKSAQSPVPTSHAIELQINAAIEAIDDDQKFAAQLLKVNASLERLIEAMQLADAKASFLLLLDSLQAYFSVNSQLINSASQSQHSYMQAHGGSSNADGNNAAGINNIEMNADKYTHTFAVLVALLKSISAQVWPLFDDTKQECIPIWIRTQVRSNIYNYWL